MNSMRWIFWQVVYARENLRTMFQWRGLVLKNVVKIIKLWYSISSISDVITHHVNYDEKIQLHVLPCTKMNSELTNIHETSMIQDALSSVV